MSRTNEQNFSVNGTISETDRALIQSDIEVYMFSNALPALALFLLILLYFPSAPQLPPSLSSQQARLGTWAGLREVMASIPAWLVAVGCSVPQAVLS